MDLLPVVTSQFTQSGHVQVTRYWIVYSVWASIVDNVHRLPNIVVDLSLDKDAAVAQDLQWHLLDENCKCSQFHCTFLRGVLAHVRSECACLSCSLSKAMTTLHTTDQVEILSSLVQGCRDSNCTLVLDQDAADLISSQLYGARVSLNVFVTTLIHRMIVETSPGVRKKTSTYIQFVRGVLHGLYVWWTHNKHLSEDTDKSTWGPHSELYQRAKTFFSAGHGKGCTCMHTWCRFVRNNIKHVPSCTNPFCCVCVVHHRYNNDLQSEAQRTTFVADVFTMLEIIEPLKHCCGFDFGHLFGDIEWFQVDVRPATTAYLMFLFEHLSHAPEKPCPVPLCEKMQIVQDAAPVMEDDFWVHGIYPDQRLYHRLCKLHSVCGPSCQVCDLRKDLHSCNASLFLVRHGVKAPVDHLLSCCCHLLRVKAFNSAEMSLHITRDVMHNQDTSTVVCALMAHMLGQCRRDREQRGLQYCPHNITFCDKWFNGLLCWAVGEDSEQFCTTVAAVLSSVCEPRRTAGTACEDLSCQFCRRVNLFKFSVPGSGLVNKFRHLALTAASPTYLSYAKAISQSPADSLWVEVLALLVYHKVSCTKPCSFAGCHAINSLQQNHDYTHCIGFFMCGHTVCRIVDLVFLHQTVCSSDQCSLCHLLKDIVRGTCKVSSAAVLTRVSQILVGWMPQTRSGADDPLQFLRECGTILLSVYSNLDTTPYSVLNVDNNLRTNFSLRSVPMYIGLNALTSLYKGCTVEQWYKISHTQAWNDRFPIVSELVQSTLNTLVKLYYEYEQDLSQVRSVAAVPFKYFAKRRATAVRFRDLCVRLLDQHARNCHRKWEKLTSLVLYNDRSGWRSLVSRNLKQRRTVKRLEAERDDVYSELVTLRQQLTKLQDVEKRRQQLQKETDKLRSCRDEVADLQQQVRSLLRFVDTVDGQVVKVRDKVKSLGLHRYPAFYKEFQHLLSVVHPKHL